MDVAIDADRKDDEGEEDTPRRRLLFEPDETWESGCLKADKEMVRFLAKCLFSGAVLGFSFFQLTQDGVDQAYYSSTVSLILGTFLGSSASAPPKQRQQHRE